MTTAIKSANPRGRPKDPAKREALLDAGRELFLARGYEVTTDEVATKAGVAKATLYANFPDKDALLEAVLRRESDRTISDEQYAESLSMDVEVALIAFGVRYLTFINERQLSGWDHLLKAAAAKHPQMPKRFFSAGPGRAQIMLTRLIGRGIEDGSLVCHDAILAAGDLTGLWLGFTSLEINLGVRAPLKPSEIRKRVERAVGLFMTLYGSA